MDYKEKYESWINDSYFDESTRAELKAIANDDKEIKERFYKDLEFGTGGLRGIIGAGTNRINIYTVGKATQGLADYILQNSPCGKTKGVAIAYDSRNMSPEFARKAGLTMCANGIKAYVFDSLRPTPELSFAVRHLGCIAGIVITASHNPPEYNGYKVYWQDGGQVPYPRDGEIIEKVNAVERFSDVKVMEYDDAVKAGLYVTVGKEIDDEYIKNVKAQSLNPDVVSATADSLRIVYTPLHGTGNIPVRRVLSETGFKNVYVLPQQELPDSSFSTVGLLYENKLPDANAKAVSLAGAISVIL